MPNITFRFTPTCRQLMKARRCFLCSERAVVGLTYHTGQQLVLCFTCYQWYGRAPRFKTTWLSTKVVK